MCSTDSKDAQKLSQVTVKRDIREHLLNVTVREPVGD